MNLSERHRDVLERIHERTSADPDGIQDVESNVWTALDRLKSDGSKPHTAFERHQVGALVEDLAEAGEVITWHGLLAPADEAHRQAIIANENQTGLPRTILQRLVANWGDRR